MANLKDFVWEGLHDGMDVDLYPYPAIGKIGKGKILEISQLRLALKGEANIPIYGKITVEGEIIMRDLAPEGLCTVIILGEKNENAPYKTSGKQLIINIPNSKIGISQVVLQDKDKSWSWLAAKYKTLPLIWVGAWPKGKAVAEEDTVAEKFK